MLTVLPCSSCLERRITCPNRTVRCFQKYFKFLLFAIKNVGKLRKKMYAKDPYIFSINNNPVNKSPNVTLH